jgi:hypothetical protein
LRHHGTSETSATGMGLDGVDHAIGRDEDRAMLGGRVVVDGEEQEIAGLEGIQRQRDHVAAGGIGERLFTQRLGPVARIGGRVFGIGAIDRAPDAAHETEAIAADALERRLMVIGRADP